MCAPSVSTGGLGRAESRGVVLLSGAVKAGVVAHPPQEAAHLGGEHVETFRRLLRVAAVLQHARDQPEIRPAGLQEFAAARHLLHAAQGLHPATHVIHGGGGDPIAGRGSGDSRVSRCPLGTDTHECHATDTEKSPPVHRFTPSK